MSLTEEIVRIINESNAEPLLEMATVCKKSDSYGIEITVNSNDHGFPHIHVNDLDGKKLAKVFITKESPKKTTDVKFLEGSLNGKQLNALVKWANESRKTTGTNNWVNVKDLWEIYQGTDNWQ